MAVEKDFENNNENDLCYLTGERYVCVSFTDRKMINRIKKIYEERAEEFKYLTQNKDGKYLCENSEEVVSYQSRIQA